MEKKQRDGRLMEIAEAFDLPPDAVAGMPHMELLGDRELYLLHHRGILSYGSGEIVVHAPPLTYRIVGKNLTLRAMTEQELRIAGRIESILLEK